MRRRIGLIAVLALAGCASTSPKDAYRDVAQKAEQQSGHRVMWDQGGDDDAKVKEAIGKLLASELSVDAAVQIALLNNPSLIATYEDLSIAQADVVQAGLLKNPVFTASYTASERDSISPPLIFGLTQDFLDLMLIPARKKVAKAQREQVKFRSSRSPRPCGANAECVHRTASSAADGRHATGDRGRGRGRGSTSRRDNTRQATSTSSNSRTSSPTSPSSRSASRRASSQ